MTAALDYSNYITVEEYLEGEKESEIRHEYHAGQVFAMAGASSRHELVNLNLAGEINQHLKGNPCRVYKSDMKLKIALNNEDNFYYPDVMVVCHKISPEMVFTESPRLIIEVLTDARRDLIEKLYAYPQIESLEEYAVVDQDPKKPRVRIFRKANDWKMEEGIENGVLKLSSIDFSITTENLFAE